MEEINRKCKYCGNEIKVKIGLHNWKNLFRKPTLEELILFIMVLMVIVSSFAYRYDIKALNSFYEDESYCKNKLSYLEGTEFNNENINNLSSSIIQNTSEKLSILNFSK